MNNTHTHGSSGSAKVLGSLDILFMSFGAIIGFGWIRLTIR
ncbi:hypothetical protein [Brevibacterium sp.]|nr:hypothetical protein [Brevibacterium sp.]